MNAVLETFRNLHFVIFYLILSFVCIHKIHTLMYMVSITIPLKKSLQGSNLQRARNQNKESVYYI